jgi:hypothetical protein
VVRGEPAWLGVPYGHWMCLSWAAYLGIFQLTNCQAVFKSMAGTVVRVRLSAVVGAAGLGTTHVHHLAHGIVRRTIVSAAGGGGVIAVGRERAGAVPGAVPRGIPKLVVVNSSASGYHRPEFGIVLSYVGGHGLNR